jgi:hypothetical protein
MCCGPSIRRGVASVPTGAPPPPAAAAAAGGMPDWRRPPPRQERRHRRACRGQAGWAGLCVAQGGSGGAPEYPAVIKTSTAPLITCRRSRRPSTDRLDTLSCGPPEHTDTQTWLCVFRGSRAWLGARWRLAGPLLTSWSPRPPQSCHQQAHPTTTQTTNTTHTRSLNLPPRKPQAHPTTTQTTTTTHTRSLTEGIEFSRLSVGLSGTLASTRSRSATLSARGSDPSTASLRKLLATLEGRCARQAHTAGGEGG